MSEAYNFLKDCGVYYLTTVNGEAPASRPFGAIMEDSGNLYFSSGRSKQVYRQILANPNIQIVGLKDGSRDWIRLSGKAIEVEDKTLKQAMLDRNPVLQSRFKKETEEFALFIIMQQHTQFHTPQGTIEK